MTKQITFNPFNWRAYMNSMLIPRLALPEGKQRVERLRDAFHLDESWMRLAGDVKPFSFPTRDDPFEALHNLVGCIAAPPGIIDPPTKEQLDEVVLALRKLKAAYVRHPFIGDHVTSYVNGHPTLGVRLPSNAANVDAVIKAIQDTQIKDIARPLMPASQGKNGPRNWLALYVRHWIMPAFFRAPHHDDIAKLIAVAYPEWQPFSDGAIEQLTPW